MASFVGNLGIEFGADRVDDEHEAVAAIGEGIEKVQEDYAAGVAKAMQV